MKKKIKKLLITFLFIIIFSNSFYLFLKLNEIHINDENLLNKQTCPLCYGQDLCSTLESNSQYYISLENDLIPYFLQAIFNVKNVFKGIENYTNKKIIFKKLAHDTELNEFDENEHNCRLKRVNSESCLSNLAIFNKTILKRKISLENFQSFVNYLNIESMQCASQRIMNLIYETDPANDNHYSDKNLMMFTTMKINVEPIILRVIIYF